MKMILLGEFLGLLILATAIGYTIAGGGTVLAVWFTVLFAIYAVLFVRDARRALK